jgi:replicative DNA helicase
MNYENPNDRRHTSALESERALLGSMIVDPDCVSEIVEIVATTDFEDSLHATIFDHLVAAPALLDAVGLERALRQSGQLEAVGGRPTLTALMEYVAIKGEAASHARAVRAASQRREILRLATTLQRDATYSPETFHALASRFGAYLAKLEERRGDNCIRSISDIAVEVLEAVTREHEAGGCPTGLVTGFAALDSLTNGLPKGGLTILAGRPSAGKTTFALSISLSATKAKKVVLFVSAEMADTQIVRNAICNLGYIDSNVVRSGQMNQHQWKLFIDGAEATKDLPIHFDTTPSPTVRHIRNAVRRLDLRQERVDLVVVDYLHLLRPTSGETREQEVAAIGRELKQLAREFDVPVLALSQLNRESVTRKDQRPTMSDLRESGSLEQDADVVLLLSPKDLAQGPSYGGRRQVVVNVAKNRNGPCGHVELTFVASQFRFEETQPT